MALYSPFLDHGREIFSAGDGGNLHGVFGEDNSSRVVELDNDGLMESSDQQEAALMYQQPPGRQTPMSGPDPTPNVAADYDIQARYRPNPPADLIYGMENAYIQRPGMYFSDNTNVNLRSTPDHSQQQPSSNTVSVAPEYAYTGTDAYHPAQGVDAGLGSQSNIDSTSVYPSQWSTQEDYYDWQRGDEDADALEHGHGKLVWY